MRGYATVTIEVEGINPEHVDQSIDDLLKMISDYAYISSVSLTIPEYEDE